MALKIRMWQSIVFILSNAHTQVQPGRTFIYELNRQIEVFSKIKGPALFDGAFYYSYIQVESYLRIFVLRSQPTMLAPVKAKNRAPGAGTTDNEQETTILSSDTQVGTSSSSLERLNAR